MTETSSELSTPWKLVRTHYGRIVVGVILTVLVFGAMRILIPYFREQRIATKFKTFGAAAQFDYCGPAWVPAKIRETLPFFNRVVQVRLTGMTVPSILLSEMGTLTSLREQYFDDTQLTDDELEKLEWLTTLHVLNLNNTQITDNGLERLREMKSLEGLSLISTKVTDVGLTHLKLLTRLVAIELDNTKTTPEGRAELRKALPRCNITPYP